MGLVVAYCWELGAGLGHVNRIKAVMDHFDGNEVTDAHFILREPAKHVSISSTKETIYQAPFGGVNIKEASPNFSHVLWRSGWHDDDFATKLVTVWMQYLKDIKPDLVLLDHSPTAAVAAHLLGLKYFHLGNGFEIPPNQSPFPSMLPWKKIKSKILVKWDKEVNQRLVRVVKTINTKSTLISFQQLFSEKNCLVISRFYLDHYSPRNTKTTYFPMLSGVKSDKSEGLKAKRNKPCVFVYLNASVANIINILVDLSADFVVIGYIAGINKTYENLLISKDIRISSKPIDIDTAMQTCDVVLCHGGMGTVSQAIENNKALYVMPSHLEQELMAYQLQRQKLGKSIHINATSNDVVKTVLSTYKQLVPNQIKLTMPKNSRLWTETIASFFNKD